MPIRRPRVVVSSQVYSEQSRGSQHSEGVLPRKPEPSLGFHWLLLQTASVQVTGVQHRSTVLPGSVSHSVDFACLVESQGCSSLHISCTQHSSRLFPGLGSSTSFHSLDGKHSLKELHMCGLRHKLLRTTSLSVITESSPLYSKPLSLAKDLTVSVAFSTSSTTPPGTVSVKNPWPPPVKAKVTGFFLKEFAVTESSHVLPTTQSFEASSAVRS
mmetsp:Transcript_7468/g.17867  ORF Transcript_7468/g.17867 Transcript_7468/m.17867 type:complete len:214 (-) Transcript_7468:223-864(-)